MVKLIWAFGFIINGVPHIEKVETNAKMEVSDCAAAIVQNSERMADWMRGVLRQDLNFPVGVRGDCEPVQREASAAPRAD
jgi:hypothetical protein